MGWTDKWNENRKDDHFWDVDTEYMKSSGITALNTFTGVDMRVIVMLNPNSTDLQEGEVPAVTLGTLRTLTISTNREMMGVRSLGNTNPKGFTQGQRLTAGTCIFGQFSEEALSQLTSRVSVLPRHDSYNYNHGTMGSDSPSEQGDGTLSGGILIDQLPPLDIVILYVNETGHISTAHLFGVKFRTSGVVNSINDLLIENTVTYMAKHYIPMRSILSLDSATPSMTGKSETDKIITGMEAMFTSLSDRDREQATQALNVHYNDILAQNAPWALNKQSDTLRSLLSDPYNLAMLKQSQNPFM